MEKTEKLEISGFELGIETFSINSCRCQLRIERAKDDGAEMLCVEHDTTEPLYYSFNGLDGLCRTTRYGSVVEKNLILEISSLDINNQESVLAFFEKNGFFFRATENPAWYDYAGIKRCLYRIVSVTAIVSELSKKKPEVDKLLNPVLYLLLADDAEISRMGADKPIYKSVPHQAIRVIRSTEIAINTDIDSEEASRKGTYSVRDTIYPDIYEISSERYDSIIAGEDPWNDDIGEELKDERYRKLASAYKVNHNLYKGVRNVLDFLFHFMFEQGVVKDVDDPNNIKFYRRTEKIALDDPMKKALEKVARAVVANEINNVISISVRPVFLEDSFETTWKATSLLAALYFSLFYMRPGRTIFKRCANPTCNKYFSVASTNGRKIYCCKKCRDANNSRRHREKEKSSTIEQR